MKKSVQRLREHPEVAMAWDLIHWHGSSYGPKDVFSTAPSGAEGVLRSAQLSERPPKGIRLLREDIPGKSPDGSMTIENCQVAAKLCKLFNEHGIGKSFSWIGNLTVDDDLNVVAD